jgi:hypothetical protein
MTTRTAFPGASARSEPVVVADERDGSLERLIHLEELERRLIARDIHDDTIAAMTAVTFECARLRALLTDDSEIKIADPIARMVEAAAGSGASYSSSNPTSFTKRGWVRRSASSSTTFRASLTSTTDWTTGRGRRRGGW